MEGEPGASQEKEELAGPEQDVQKAAAFEIIKILRMETDVERLAGTLFDESPHGSQVDGMRAEAAAPGGPSARGSRSKRPGNAPGKDPADSVMQLRRGRKMVRRSFVREALSL